VDVKALSKTRDGHNTVSRLRNEIAVMSYLAGHPNIVRLRDVYESDGHMFLVQVRSIVALMVFLLMDDV